MNDKQIPKWIDTVSNWFIVLCVIANLLVLIGFFLK